MHGFGIFYLSLTNETFMIIRFYYQNKLHFLCMCLLILADN